MPHKLKKLALYFGDILVFYLTLYLTLLLRYQHIPSTELWQKHLPIFTLAFVFWLPLFYITNLYDLYLAVNNSNFWKRATTAIFGAALIATSLFYVTASDVAPKTNLAIYFVIFSGLFPLWRQVYNSALASYLPKLNIGFIGLNAEAKEIIDFLKSHSHIGYSVAATYEAEDVKLNNLKEEISLHNIALLVVATNLHESSSLRDQLFACLPLKVNFINLPLFYEQVTGKIPTNVINQMWFLENLTEGGRGNFNLIKRVCDIFGATALLIITMPFWPLIAILIKASSTGPVFFSQTRGGKNAAPFKMLKFRSMRVENNDASLTVEGDKRITKFGNFLRKSRIDELPQLINILKGEMSFIGPRPERPEFITDLEKAIPFYRERMLVKPGVTGWDQVSGEYHSASTEDTIKKLQYDLFYIKNRSIYLDISIMLKTVYTILNRSGR
ncbi:MAG: sugar transferase [bacterium]